MTACTEFRSMRQGRERHGCTLEHGHNGPHEYPLLASQVREFEIHAPAVRADTKWLSKFGPRIRDQGGRYSECRGYMSTRFVHVPGNARALLDEVLSSLEGESFVVVVRTVQTFYANVETCAWFTVDSVVIECRHGLYDYDRLMRRVEGQAVRAVDQSKEEIYRYDSESFKERRLTVVRQQLVERIANSRATISSIALDLERCEKALAQLDAGEPVLAVELSTLNPI